MKQLSLLWLTVMVLFIWIAGLSSVVVVRPDLLPMIIAKPASGVFHPPLCQDAIERRLVSIKARNNAQSKERITFFSNEVKALDRQVDLFCFEP